LGAAAVDRAQAATISAGLAGLAAVRPVSQARTLAGLALAGRGTRAETRFCRARLPVAEVVAQARSAVLPQVRHQPAVGLGCLVAFLDRPSFMQVVAVAAETLAALAMLALVASAAVVIAARCRPPEVQRTEKTGWRTLAAAEGRQVALRTERTIEPAEAAGLA